MSTKTNSLMFFNNIFRFAAQLKIDRIDYKYPPSMYSNA